MAFVNNLVVGKGRLYFARFAQNSRAPAQGQGLLYFGNTPTLEVSRTATALDHFDADNGIKVKDDSIEIETAIQGKFTCDNINSDNLALFFGGNKTLIAQAAGAALTETFTAAVVDNYYQIGVTAADPDGIKTVTGFTATGTAPLVAETDYHFDPLSGLFHILPGGAITVPQDVHVTYTQDVQAQEQVIEAGLAIYGALKFVSSNPKGRQRDYFYPYVKLSADTPLALKGDTWQTVGWSYEALKRDDATNRVYVTAR